MQDSFEALKKYFKSKKNIQLAFLFGSQAKGRAIKESDFDIAIWPEAGVPQEEINLLWQEIEGLLHSNVDLILLPKARPTVAWSALRGKRLLIRDFKLYLNLFLNVSREAEDIQDFLIDYRKLQVRYAK